MHKKEADFIKQYSYLRQVLKLSTEELRKSNWDYNISLRDAKRSGAVISLAESTCIRMIEQIAGIDLHKNLSKFEKIRTELRELRREKRSKEVENRIKLLYSALDECVRRRLTAAGAELNGHGAALAVGCRPLFDVVQKFSVMAVSATAEICYLGG